MSLYCYIMNDWSFRVAWIKTELQLLYIVHVFVKPQETSGLFTMLYFKCCFFFLIPNTCSCHVCMTLHQRYEEMYYRLTFCAIVIGGGCTAVMIRNILSNSDIQISVHMDRRTLVYPQKYVAEYRHLCATAIKLSSTGWRTKKRNGFKQWLIESFSEHEDIAVWNIISYLLTVVRMNAV